MNECYSNHFGKVWVLLGILWSYGPLSKKKLQVSMQVIASGKGQYLGLQNISEIFYFTHYNSNGLWLLRL